MIIKKKLKPIEKRKILKYFQSIEFINIYLLYNIYLNRDHATFYYTEDLNLFCSVSSHSRELHFYSRSDKYTENFVKFIKEKKIKFTYLCGDAISIQNFLKYYPSIIGKIVYSDDYYFFSLNKNEKNVNFLKTIIANHPFKDNLKFNIPVKKKSVVELVKLQMGYYSEEMNYPANILNENFIKHKLIDIYKNFKIFYLTYNNRIVAKCEWNAYTDKVFQIGGVYTLPTHRKKGFSSFLLSKMILYSFENVEMDKATLFVRKENFKAISLYKKLGFKLSGLNIKWIIIKS